MVHHQIEFRFTAFLGHSLEPSGSDDGQKFRMSLGKVLDKCQTQKKIRLEGVAIVVQTNVGLFGVG